MAPECPLRATPTGHAVGRIGEQDGIGRGAGRAPRVVLMFVGITVGLLVLSWMAVILGGASPRTNVQARHLEDVLTGLPTIDAAAVGLAFDRQHSDAGAAATGSMADDPDPVTVTRHYTFSGDALATCQLVTSEMERSGTSEVEQARPCERMGDEGSAVATSQRDCRSFLVSTTVRVTSAAASYDPGTVEIRLETQYPERADDTPSSLVEEDHATTPRSSGC